MRPEKVLPPYLKETTGSLIQKVYLQQVTNKPTRPSLLPQHLQSCMQKTASNFFLEYPEEGSAGLNEIKTPSARGLWFSPLDSPALKDADRRTVPSPANDGCRLSRLPLESAELSPLKDARCRRNASLVPGARGCSAAGSMLGPYLEGRRGGTDEGPPLQNKGGALCSGAFVS